MSDEDREKPQGRLFGQHVRSLRRARGMTQEVLAERCELSPDTIRRLERGSFSPSLDTLNKVCAGLQLEVGTLFESFKLGARNESRELVDLVATRSLKDVRLATRVMRSLFIELDRIAAEMDRDAEEAERHQPFESAERDRKDRQRRQQFEARERKKCTSH
jgi:transcriptional regulator with XRE-family HTH domain